MLRTGSVFPAAAVSLFFLIAAATPASAQPVQTSQGGLGESRRGASAASVDTPPVVDGLLEDPAWQAAEPLADFTQAEPADGQPASEGTEVRIVYDDEAIYVGVVCHDSEPAQIITTDTRRDTQLGNQDSFQIVFDTFRDQQNGFVFGTNAAGAQFDAQVRDEGRANSSWDGSWDVRTQLTDTGWTAEFRIPLRTLRYGPAPQTWDINVARNIQRRRERTYWAPLSRIYDLDRDFRFARWDYNRSSLTRKFDASADAASSDSSSRRSASSPAHTLATQPASQPAPQPAAPTPRRTAP